MTKEIQHKVML